MKVFFFKKLSPSYFLIFPTQKFFLNFKKKLTNEMENVSSLVWVWITGLIDGGSHIRMQIIVRTIPIWFLAFHVCSPERSQNGSECVRICEFKRNSSNSYRPPKMRDSVLLNSWYSFSVTLPSISSENLCDIFLNSRNGRVSWLAVPRMFLLCFSCNVRQLSSLSQCCHLFQGKKCSIVLKTELFCFLLTNSRE